MTDYKDAIEQLDGTAPILATTSLDHNPDDGARALALSRATGAPPLTVYDDLDGFEADHRAALTSGIVRNNDRLAAYLRGNPLADVVSNDDYGNLDNFTRTAQGVMAFYKHINLWSAFTQGTAKSFEEAGTAPLGEAIEKTGSSFVGTAMAVPMQLLGMLSAPIGGAQEVVRRAGELGGDTTGGEQLARDIGGIFESEMMRMGDHPTGMHPEIDAAKADLNAKLVGEITTNLEAAQAVLTKERDPILAEAYFKQHYETASLGISGDRILELYGDRVPSPDDGLLGWVPDLAAQLEAAKLGDDVHVPLVAWMTHVDPAVAKELMDDIRVWPGGITAREAAAPREYPPVVDAPLAQARASLGTEPLFSLIGDRKLELKFIPGKFKDFHDYQFLDASGKTVGEISIIPDPAKKELYVANINGLAGLYSNSFGPSLIRDLKKQLKAIYPEYEWITGHRVSGARYEAGTWDTEIAYPKVRLSEAEGWGSVETATELSNFRKLFEQKYGEQFSGAKKWTVVSTPEGDALSLGGIALEPLGQPMPLIEFLNQKFRAAEVAIEDPTITAAAKTMAYVIDNMGLGKMRTYATSHTDTHFPKAGGFYNPIDPIVVVREQAPLNQLKTTIHEAAHAVFHNAIETNPEVKATIREMMQFVADDLGLTEAESAVGFGRDYYGMTNEHEFVSEAFSNPRFQKILKETKVTPLWLQSKGISLTRGIKTAWDYLLHVVRETFGLEDTEANRTVLEAIIKYGEKLEEEANKGEGAPLGTPVESRSSSIELDRQRQLMREQIDDLLSIPKEDGTYAELRVGEKKWHNSVLLTEAIARGTVNIAHLPEFLREPARELQRAYKEKWEGPLFSAADDAREQLNHIRATVAGLDKKTFERMQKLIAQRHEEDVAAATARAEKLQRKTQTAEWKKEAAAVRKEVADRISNRPDVLADQFIGAGELGGKKIRQVNPLRADDLTPEQKAALPKHYYAKDGIPVDQAARLFGFRSGDMMVNAVIEYHKTKEGRTTKEHLQATIDEAVQRQMERLHGKLDENIMSEAQDQALSETNLNLVAEEWQAAAMQAGVAVVDKDVAKAHALEVFSQMKMANVDFGRLQTQMLKHYNDAVKDLVNGDPATAVVRLQRRYELGLLAAEAKKLQKEQARFERTAKQFSKREVPSVEPEYTNFIHDILQRVGKPVRRSIQDVAKEISMGESPSLEQFVATKTGQYRELAVWDQLFDSAWRKPVEEMTVEEFRAVANSIKSLVHNGRDERKIYRGEQAADLAEKKKEAIEAIERSAKGEIQKPTKTKVGKVLRNFYVSHLQFENILNRWDAFDPKGVWNQYVMRDLIDGANQVDAWRKEYAKRIKELPTPKNLDRSIDNPIFVDVDTKIPMEFTRKNLITVMLNMGTGTGKKSNLWKLADGYGLTPEQVTAWVHTHATAEDWAFVRGVWDIFADIKKKSDTMYRSLSGGVPAEDVPVFPIQTPHGTIQGGYYPIIFHSEMEGKSKKLMGKDPLEQDGYFRATTPAGYTKSRTGYTAPLALDLDQMPGRLGQMLQDIGLRPAVINASKLFYDHDVRSAVRKHYGTEYKDEMLAYLRGVANSANQMEKSQQALTAASEFIRQNMITTLVGINPGTVLKHGPTAAVLSAVEVGPRKFISAFFRSVPPRFLHWVQSMFRIGDQVAEDNWQFAIKHSLELQRRDRNWEESLYGATAGLVPGEKFAPWRQKIMQWSSKPVALSDMISAVPTWLAGYEEEIAAGGSHGDAVNMGDRAVRRAHGSTAITNRTAIMRTANPWLTSVYNFFSDIMNRQMETIWRSGEILDLVKEGSKKAAMAAAGVMIAKVFAYSVWPAIVEHMVSGQAEDEHESWAISAGKAMVRSTASSWVGVRDFVNWMLYGFDPQLGMAGTAMKELGSAINDLKKDHPFRKDHAGRLIQDGAGMVGAMTGMMPQQIGRTSRYLYDVNQGREHPRGPWEWLVGLRYGTTKGHSRTAEDYMKGKVRK